MTNELYHHGVKGMKWGVRRYQNKDGSLTSAGRSRYNYGKVGVNRQGGQKFRKEYGVSDADYKRYSGQKFRKEYGVSDADYKRYKRMFG